MPNVMFGAQLLKRINLAKSEPDQEIPYFAIEDQQIHLTFVAVFQNNIGLDHSDPNTNVTRLPNPDNQSSYWDYKDTVINTHRH